MCCQVPYFGGQQPGPKQDHSYLALGQVLRPLWASTAEKGDVEGTCPDVCAEQLNLCLDGGEEDAYFGITMHEVRSEERKRCLLV